MSLREDSESKLNNEDKVDQDFFKGQMVARYKERMSMGYVVGGQERDPPDEPSTTAKTDPPVPYPRIRQPQPPITEKARAIWSGQGPRTCHPAMKELITKFENRGFSGNTGEELQGEKELETRMAREAWRTEGEGRLQLDLDPNAVTSSSSEELISKAICLSSSKKDLARASMANIRLITTTESFNNTWKNDSNPTLQDKPSEPMIDIERTEAETTTCPKPSLNELKKKIDKPAIDPQVELTKYPNKAVSGIKNECGVGASMGRNSPQDPQSLIVKSNSTTSSPTSRHTRMSLKAMAEKASSTTKVKGRDRYVVHQKEWYTPSNTDEKVSPLLRVTPHGDNSGDKQQARNSPKPSPPPRTIFSQKAVRSPSEMSMGQSTPERRPLSRESVVETRKSAAMERFRKFLEQNLTHVEKPMVRNKRQPRLDSQRQNRVNSKSLPPISRSPSTSQKDGLPAYKITGKYRQQLTDRSDSKDTKHVRTDSSPPDHIPIQSGSKSSHCAQSGKGNVDASKDSSLTSKASLTSKPPTSLTTSSRLSQPRRAPSPKSKIQALGSKFLGTIQPPGNAEGTVRNISVLSKDEMADNDLVPQHLRGIPVSSSSEENSTIMTIENKGMKIKAKKLLKMFQGPKGKQPLLDLSMESPVILGKSGKTTPVVESQGTTAAVDEIKGDKNKDNPNAPQRSGDNQESSLSSSKLIKMTNTISNSISGSPPPSVKPRSRSLTPNKLTPKLPSPLWVGTTDDKSATKPLQSQMHEVSATDSDKIFPTEEFPHFGSHKTASTVEIFEACSPDKQTADSPKRKRRKVDKEIENTNQVEKKSSPETLIKVDKKKMKGKIENVKLREPDPIRDKKQLKYTFQRKDARPIWGRNSKVAVAVDKVGRNERFVTKDPEIPVQAQIPKLPFENDYFPQRSSGPESSDHCIAMDIFRDGSRGSSREGTELSLTSNKSDAINYKDAISLRNSKSRRGEVPQLRDNEKIFHEPSGNSTSLSLERKLRAISGDENSTIRKSYVVLKKQERAPKADDEGIEDKRNDDQVKYNQDESKRAKINDSPFSQEKQNQAELKRKKSTLEGGDKSDISVSKKPVNSLSGEKILTLSSTYKFTDITPPKTSVRHGDSSAVKTFKMHRTPSKTNWKEIYKHPKRPISEPTDRWPVKSLIPVLVADEQVTPRMRRLSVLAKYRRWRETHLKYPKRTKLPMSKTFRRILARCMKEEKELHLWSPIFANHSLPSEIFCAGDASYHGFLISEMTVQTRREANDTEIPELLAQLRNELWKFNAATASNLPWYYERNVMADSAWLRVNEDIDTVTQTSLGEVKRSKSIKVKANPQDLRPDKSDFMVHSLIWLEIKLSTTNGLVFGDIENTQWAKNLTLLRTICFYIYPYAIPFHFISKDTDHLVNNSTLTSFNITDCWQADCPTFINATENILRAVEIHTTIEVLRVLDTLDEERSVFHVYAVAVHISESACNDDIFWGISPTGDNGAFMCPQDLDANNNARCYKPKRVRGLIKHKYLRRCTLFSSSQLGCPNELFSSENIYLFLRKIPTDSQTEFETVQSTHSLNDLCEIVNFSRVPGGALKHRIESSRNSLSSSDPLSGIPVFTKAILHSSNMSVSDKTFSRAAQSVIGNGLNNNSKWWDSTRTQNLSQVNSGSPFTTDRPTKYVKREKAREGPEKNSKHQPERIDVEEARASARVEGENSRQPGKSKTAPQNKSTRQNAKNPVSTSKKHMSSELKDSADLAPLKLRRQQRLDRPRPWDLAPPCPESQRKNIVWSKASKMKAKKREPSWIKMKADPFYSHRLNSMNLPCGKCNEERQRKKKRPKLTLKERLNNLKPVTLNDNFCNIIGASKIPVPKRILECRTMPMFHEVSQSQAADASFPTCQCVSALRSEFASDENRSTRTTETGQSGFSMASFWFSCNIEMDKRYDTNDMRTRVGRPSDCANYDVSDDLDQRCWHTPKKDRKRAPRRSKKSHSIDVKSTEFQKRVQALVNSYTDFLNGLEKRQGDHQGSSPRRRESNIGCFRDNKRARTDHAYTDGEHGCNTRLGNISGLSQEQNKSDYNITDGLGLRQKDAKAAAFSEEVLSCASHYEHALGSGEGGCFTNAAQLLEKSRGSVLLKSEARANLHRSPDMFENRQLKEKTQTKTGDLETQIVSPYGIHSDHKARDAPLHDSRTNVLSEKKTNTKAYATDYETPHNFDIPVNHLPKHDTSCMPLLDLNKQQEITARLETIKRYKIPEKYLNQPAVNKQLPNKPEVFSEVETDGNDEKTALKTNQEAALKLYDAQYVNNDINNRSPPTVKLFQSQSADSMKMNYANCSGSASSHRQQKPMKNQTPTKSSVSLRHSPISCCVIRSQPCADRDSTKKSSSTWTEMINNKVKSLENKVSTMESLNRLSTDQQFSDELSFYNTGNHSNSLNKDVSNGLKPDVNKTQANKLLSPSTSSWLSGTNNVGRKSSSTSDTNQNLAKTCKRSMELIHQHIFPTEGQKEKNIPDNSWVESSMSTLKSIPDLPYNDIDDRTKSFQIQHCSNSQGSITGGVKTIGNTKLSDKMAHGNKSIGTTDTDTSSLFPKVVEGTLTFGEKSLKETDPRSKCKILVNKADVCVPDKHGIMRRWKRMKHKGNLSHNKPLRKNYFGPCLKRIHYSPKSAASTSNWSIKEIQLKQQCCRGHEVFNMTENAQTPSPTPSAHLFSASDIACSSNSNSPRSNPLFDTVLRFWETQAALFKGLTQPQMSPFRYPENKGENTRKEEVDSNSGTIYHSLGKTEEDYFNQNSRSMKTDSEKSRDALSIAVAQVTEVVKNMQTSVEKPSPDNKKKASAFSALQNKNIIDESFLKKDNVQQHKPPFTLQSTTNKYKKVGGSFENPTKDTFKEKLSEMMDKSKVPQRVKKHSPKFENDSSSKPNVPKACKISKIPRWVPPRARASKRISPRPGAETNSPELTIQNLDAYKLAHILEYIRSAQPDAQPTPEMLMNSLCVCIGTKSSENSTSYQNECENVKSSSQHLPDGREVQTNDTSVQYSALGQLKNKCTQTSKICQVNESGFFKCDKCVGSPPELELKKVHREISSEELFVRIRHTGDVNHWTKILTVGMSPTEVSRTDKTRQHPTEFDSIPPQSNAVSSGDQTNISVVVSKMEKESNMGASSGGYTRTDERETNSESFYMFKESDGMRNDINIYESVPSTPSSPLQSDHCYIISAGLDHTSDGSNPQTPTMTESIANNRTILAATPPRKLTAQDKGTYLLRNVPSFHSSRSNARIIYREEKNLSVFVPKPVSAVPHSVSPHKPVARALTSPPYHFPDNSSNVDVTSLNFSDIEVNLSYQITTPTQTPLISTQNRNKTKDQSAEVQTDLQGLDLEIHFKSSSEHKKRPKQNYARRKYNHSSVEGLIKPSLGKRNSSFDLGNRNGRSPSSTTHENESPSTIDDDSVGISTNLHLNQNRLMSFLISNSSEMQSGNQKSKCFTDKTKEFIPPSEMWQDPKAISTIKCKRSKGRSSQYSHSPKASPAQTHHDSFPIYEGNTNETVGDHCTEKKSKHKSQSGFKGGVEDRSLIIKASPPGVTFRFGQSNETGQTGPVGPQQKLYTSKVKSKMAKEDKTQSSQLEQTLLNENGKRPNDHTFLTAKKDVFLSMGDIKVDHFLPKDRLRKRSSPIMLHLTPTAVKNAPSYNLIKTSVKQSLKIPKRSRQLRAKGTNIEQSLKRNKCSSKRFRSRDFLHSRIMTTPRSSRKPKTSLSCSGLSVDQTVDIPKLWSDTEVSRSSSHRKINTLTSDLNDRKTHKQTQSIKKKSIAAHEKGRNDKVDKEEPKVPKKKATSTFREKKERNGVDEKSSISLYEFLDRDKCIPTLNTKPKHSPAKLNCDESKESRKLPTSSETNELPSFKPTPRNSQESEKASKKSSREDESTPTLKLLRLALQDDDFKRESATNLTNSSSERNSLLDRLQKLQVQYSQQNNANLKVSVSNVLESLLLNHKKEKKIAHRATAVANTTLMTCRKLCKELEVLPYVSSSAPSTSWSFSTTVRGGKDGFKSGANSYLHSTTTCTLCEKTSSPFNLLPSQKIRRSISADNVPITAEDAADIEDVIFIESSNQDTSEWTDQTRDVEIVLGDDVPMNEFLGCFMNGLQQQANNSRLTSSEMSDEKVSHSLESQVKEIIEKIFRRKKKPRVFSEGQPLLKKEPHGLCKGDNGSNKHQLVRHEKGRDRVIRSQVQLEVAPPCGLTDTDQKSSYDEFKTSKSEISTSLSQSAVQTSSVFEQNIINLKPKEKCVGRIETGSSDKKRLIKQNESDMGTQKPNRCLNSLDLTGILCNDSESLSKLYNVDLGIRKFKTESLTINKPINSSVRKIRRKHGRVQVFALLDQSPKHLAVAPPVTISFDEINDAGTTFKSPPCRVGEPFHLSKEQKEPCSLPNNMSLSDTSYWSADMPQPSDNPNRVRTPSSDEKGQRARVQRSSIPLRLPKKLKSHPSPLVVSKIEDEKKSDQSLSSVVPDGGTERSSFATDGSSQTIIFDKIVSSETSETTESIFNNYKTVQGTLKKPSVSDRNRERPQQTVRAILTPVLISSYSNKSLTTTDSIQKKSEDEQLRFSQKSSKISGRLLPETPVSEISVPQATQTYRPQFEQFLIVKTPPLSPMLLEEQPMFSSQSVTPTLDRNLPWDFTNDQNISKKQTSQKNKYTFSENELKSRTPATVSAKDGAQVESLLKENTMAQLQTHGESLQTPSNEKEVSTSSAEGVSGKTTVQGEKETRTHLEISLRGEVEKALYAMFMDQSKLKSLPSKIVSENGVLLVGLQTDSTQPTCGPEGFVPEEQSPVQRTEEEPQFEGKPGTTVDKIQSGQTLRYFPGQQTAEHCAAGQLSADSCGQSFHENQIIDPQTCEQYGTCNFEHGARQKFRQIMVESDSEYNETNPVIGERRHKHTTRREGVRWIPHSNITLKKPSKVSYQKRGRRHGGRIQRSGSDTSIVTVLSGDYQATSPHKMKYISELSTSTSSQLDQRRRIKTKQVVKKSEHHRRLAETKRKRNCSVQNKTESSSRRDNDDTLASDSINTKPLSLNEKCLKEETTSIVQKASVNDLPVNDSNQKIEVVETQPELPQQSNNETKHEKENSVTTAEPTLYKEVESQTDTIPETKPEVRYESTQTIEDRLQQEGIKSDEPVTVPLAPMASSPYFREEKSDKTQNKMLTSSVDREQMTDDILDFHLPSSPQIGLGRPTALKSPYKYAYIDSWIPKFMIKERTVGNAKDISPRRDAWSSDVALEKTFGGTISKFKDTLQSWKNSASHLEELLRVDKRSKKKRSPPRKESSPSFQSRERLSKSSPNILSQLRSTLQESVTDGPRIKSSSENSRRGSAATNGSARPQTSLDDSPRHFQQQPRSPKTSVFGPSTLLHQPRSPPPVRNSYSLMKTPVGSKDLLAPSPTAPKQVSRLQENRSSTKSASHLDDVLRVLQSLDTESSVKKTRLQVTDSDEQVGFTVVRANSTGSNFRRELSSNKLNSRKRELQDRSSEASHPRDHTPSALQSHDGTPTASRSKLGNSFQDFRSRRESSPMDDLQSHVVNAIERFEDLVDKSPVQSKQRPEQSQSALGAQSDDYLIRSRKDQLPKWSNSHLEQSSMGLRSQQDYSPSAIQEYPSSMPRSRQEQSPFDSGQRLVRPFKRSRPGPEDSHVRPRPQDNSPTMSRSHQEDSQMRSRSQQEDLPMMSRSRQEDSQMRSRSQQEDLPMMSRSRQEDSQMRSRSQQEDLPMMPRSRQEDSQMRSRSQQEDLPMMSRSRQEDSQMRSRTDQDNSLFISRSRLEDSSTKPRPRQNQILNTKSVEYMKPSIRRENLYMRLISDQESSPMKSRSLHEDSFIKSRSQRDDSSINSSSRQEHTMMVSDSDSSPSMNEHFPTETRKWEDHPSNETRLLSDWSPDDPDTRRLRSPIGSTSPKRTSEAHRTIPTHDSRLPFEPRFENVSHSADSDKDVPGSRMTRDHNKRPHFGQLPRKTFFEPNGQIYDQGSGTISDVPLRSTWRIEGSNLVSLKKRLKGITVDKSARMPIRPKKCKVRFSDEVIFNEVPHSTGLSGNRMLQEASPLRTTAWSSFGFEDASSDSTLTPGSIRSSPRRSGRTPYSPKHYSYLFGDRGVARDTMTEQSCTAREASPYNLSPTRDALSPRNTPDKIIDKETGNDMDWDNTIQTRLKHKSVPSSYFRRSRN